MVSFTLCKFIRPISYLVGWCTCIEGYYNSTGTLSSAYFLHKDCNGSLFFTYTYKHPISISSHAFLPHNLLGCWGEHPVAGHSQVNVRVMPSFERKRTWFDECVNVIETIYNNKLFMHRFFWQKILQTLHVISCRLRMLFSEFRPSEGCRTQSKPDSGRVQKKGRYGPFCPLKK